ncbi:NAD(P)H-dependent oxidoreductase [Williamsoniiplasma somnilux]|uniref:NAD(P)H-dependent oxidoreductase n=1 Tax=Williamsoniiplasma somnilux TaxID=215578 RepID=A0A2K8NYQ3_9MOLU|nr:nitroreductase family protein [Williamsoniiplasma somnilux]ATZ18686.1 NAD(P)H-dependent oxidoreductase [Williamsoniiplasma somnilux]
MNNQKNSYVFELVRNRRATKRMKSGFTITDEQLRLITESIRWTSMSYGVWCYRIIVVPRGQLRDELAPVWYNQPSFINSSHVIIFLHDKENKIRNKTMNNSFNKAIPDSAIEIRDVMKNAVLNNWATNNVNPDEWSAKQTYIALGTAMIAVADLGLDSSPYEGFDRNAVEAILEKHNLINRQEESVSVAIGIGKADLDDNMVHFFEKERMDEDKFTTIIKK